MKWYYVFITGVIFGQACSSFPPSFPTSPPNHNSASATETEIFPTNPPSTIFEPTAEPIETQIDTSLKQLRLDLLKGLTPAATPDGDEDLLFGGIADIQWRDFPPASDGNLSWFLYTLGTRSYQPQQNHFVAVYAYENGHLNQLSRFELEHIDYINNDSVELGTINPGSFWITIKSGTGAHSGCFDYFTFDRYKLEHQISSCASSPEAGWVEDLDGNEIPEVVLNWSEDYVFCYACGVRIPMFGLYRWDGKQIVEVNLSEIQNHTSNQAVEMNNEAVQLAKAELWMDARSKIIQAKELDGQNSDLIYWNAILINLIADARENAVSESPLPLLSAIFYGDYSDAIDRLGEYPPRVLFSENVPLIQGTPAQGQEQVLHEWIDTFTTKALRLKPDLAAAYFLRAWSTSLVDPDSPDVARDLETAIDLGENEKLFLDSYLFLRGSE